MKSLTKAFAVASALSIALSVQAAPEESQVAVKQKIVSYGDLNLQEAAGASLLLQRLTTAAKSVCTSSSTSETAISRRTMALQACRAEALENAVADVNHPVVTAMYEGKRHVVASRFATGR